MSPEPISTSVENPFEKMGSESFANLLKEGKQHLVAIDLQRNIVHPLSPDITALTGSLPATLEDLIQESDDQRVNHFRSELTEGGKVELDLDNKQGKVTTTSIRLFDAGNDAIPGFEYFLIQDETGRLEAEEVHRQQIRDMFRRFSRTMGHNLKTPLAAIGTAMYLIGGNYKNAKSFIYAELGLTDETANDSPIWKAIEKFQTVVTNKSDVVQQQQDTLDLFARKLVTAGSLLSENRSVEKIPTQISETIEYAVELAKTKEVDTQTKDIEINWELDSNTTLGFDPSLLTETLVEVVGNATRFSPKDSHVGLNVKQAGNFLVISIANEGDGHYEITNESWGLFAGDIDGNRKGMGLGLNIAYESIMLMGGDIRTQSDKASGTVVTLFVPVAKFT